MWKVESISTYFISIVTLLASVWCTPLLAREYVLEDKKIIIPEYPNAFNPSIVRWNDELLLSFRISNPANDMETFIGLCWLDENFKLNKEKKIQFLKTELFTRAVLTSAQDARLLTVDDKLYIVYNDASITGALLPRRMYVAELNYVDDTFEIVHAEIMQSYEGASLQRWEKNWVPFDYEGNLLLAYSIAPHKVLYPILGTSVCETFAFSVSTKPWKFGELRGGTPALICDDEYLSFFHSYDALGSRRYLMGAYTFSLDPPFELTAMSDIAIPTEGRIAFPGGFLVSKKYIWLVYGMNDERMRVMKIDRHAFMDTLKPVSAI